MLIMDLRNHRPKPLRPKVHPWVASQVAARPIPPRQTVWRSKLALPLGAVILIAAMGMGFVQICQWLFSDESSALPHTSTQKSDVANPVTHEIRPVHQPSPSNFRALDEFVAALPNHAAESVASLAQALGSAPGCSASETARARAAYFWVARNIRYDLAYLSETEPQTVLRNRRAVCAGYAQLFTALCRAMELTCETITGEVPRALARRFQGITGHAWNAVKVHGVWKLLDVTWASNEDGSVNNCFFLVAPEEFIHSHFPEGEKWQFLGDKAWTAARFHSVPAVQQEFFELGLRLSSHLEDSIRVDATGMLVVSFVLDPSRPDIRLKPVLLSGGNELPSPMMRRVLKSNGKIPDSNRWEIQFHLGEFVPLPLELVVFGTATPLNSSTGMNSLVTFQLEK
jgi:hypothetical protein